MDRQLTGPVSITYNDINAINNTCLSLIACTKLFLAVSTFSEVWYNSKRKQMSCNAKHMCRFIALLPLQKNEAYSCNTPGSRSYVEDKADHLFFPYLKPAR